MSSVAGKTFGPIFVLVTRRYFVILLQSIMISEWKSRDGIAARKYIYICHLVKISEQSFVCCVAQRACPFGRMVCVRNYRTNSNQCRMWGCDTGGYEEDIMPCSPLKVNRRYHLFSRWFHARHILWPWGWKRYVFPKRRLIFEKIVLSISMKFVIPVFTL
jgi:hypothetical protein